MGDVLNHIGYVVDSIEDALLNLEDLVEVDPDMEPFAEEISGMLSAVVLRMESESKRLGGVEGVSVSSSAKFPLGESSDE